MDFQEGPAQVAEEAVRIIRCTFAANDVHILYLKRIKLVQFKNYGEQELEFHEQLNCLVGRNGMGKTNMLDAIYYLCVGKSYFGGSDSHVVQQGRAFFRLEGELMNEGDTEKVVIKVEPRKRKEIERNDLAYEKLADHVGRFPVVISVPDDTALVTEGSEVRRRFIDNTLSQLDLAYLQALIEYNQVLRQRNALLKQAGGRKVEEELLLVYDRQLKEPAELIFARRIAFVEHFKPIWLDAYQAISGGSEMVGLRYRSQLNESSLPDMLLASRDKDRVLERTNVGVHKDDLIFTLAERPLKRMGSQGQLKTFVLALKLAQYRFLMQEKARPPILLLDDIFDKLDPTRVDQLIQHLLAGRFGQVFISDTDPRRVEHLLEKQGTDHAVFLVEDGQIRQR